MTVGLYSGDRPPTAIEPSRRDMTALLLIAGGADDRVYVGYTAPDRGHDWTYNYLNLAEPWRGDEPEIRIAGGQKTRLPARWWVDRDLALQALRHFVRVGQPAPEFTWEPTKSA